MSELPQDALDTPLMRALLEFTECVGTSIPDICAYALTVGETSMAFGSPEECDNGGDECEQIWVRVDSVDVEAQETWGGDCAATWTITLEVGVNRCFPEDETLPDPATLLVAVSDAMSDMQKIQCAAMSCDVWDSIQAVNWAPHGPLGGRHGGIWGFIVKV